METIYKTLERLGLTTIEGQIYVFLAQNGPKKRQDIYVQFNTGAEEINSSLIALKNKGFVRLETYRYDIFSIVPFDLVLQQLIDEKKRKIDSLKSQSAADFSN